MQSTVKLNKYKIKTKVDYSDYNKLRKTINNGDVIAVRRLIKGGVDVNSFPRSSTLYWDGTTNLHVAVAKNYTEIVKLLLSAHANVRIANNHGITPLHIAVRSGNAEITSELIAAGSDVDAITMDCNTSLHIATWRKKTKVVRLLLEAQADVNITDRDNFTPLYWAAKLNLSEIAQLLVEHGADLNHCVVNTEYTALHEALRNGYMNLSKYLIREGADVNVKAKNEGVLELLDIQHLDPTVFMDIIDFCLCHGYQLSRESLTKKVLSEKTLQNCEEIHQWLHRKLETVPPLSDISRNFIRRRLSICMRTQIHAGIERLPLPPLLKDYLAFKEEDGQSSLI